ncbi:MAG: alkene reductase [Hydrocarboniphaga sp.]|uniref:alkene reductase n=1 Tax=Hydrocarboniphaga sp. TaxID=2033016 RepID=UPI002605186A|nr:alkene reductase [Hydrocarboniphaga sp.]MDB5972303.1 alkene reductase [Hydrocarboniphaga sp.]
MTATDLFEPFEHAGLRLRNRIALAPLTRARASSVGLPGAAQAEYYRQRASAGLLITEAIAVAPEGRGGAFTPGLYDDAQVAGWKLTTDAVHAAGGLIFAQLWHAGRLSHSSLTADGAVPVSPAAAIAPGSAFTEAGFVPYEMPRVLATREVEAVAAQFRRAAENARRAGFDGVQLHATHGYLIDSFLRDAINDRSDRYGGSLENRARLLVETLSELIEVFGGDRVAVRLAPNTRAGGMSDSDTAATFAYVIDRLNERGVGWLDLVEGDNLVTRTPDDAIDTDALAARFRGAVIVNHLYTTELAIAARRERKADMVAFGRLFIGNPDLVARLKSGSALVEAARDHYYGGSGEGYIDYPALTAVR